MSARHLPQSLHHPHHPARGASEVHVHGVMSLALEVVVCAENLLPLLVLLHWRRPRERSVADKLLAALSAIYILSALVPTPLGLASYFHGAWYGGAATCESFQVTSTWCSLAALAVVTYLAVDLHLTACATRPSRTPRGRGHTPDTCGARALPSQPPSSPSLETDIRGSPSSSSSGGGGRDLTNIILFFIVIVSVLIASLPVAGYGPEVMSDNVTCHTWLLHTPPPGQRRTYFLAVLTFGFLCLSVVAVSVTATLCLLRSLHGKGQQQQQPWEGQPRYTEEPFRNSPYTTGGGVGGAALPSSSSSSCGEGGSRSDSYCYKMAGLVVANQIMWVPVLVTVSMQKAGYPVTDATILYAILFTSLPGLLNPLLLALLFRDYRLGYRYVLLHLCCCCCCHPSPSAAINTLKNLRRTGSTDSLNHPQDLGGGELCIDGDSSVQDSDDVTTARKSYPAHLACSQQGDAESDVTGAEVTLCHQSYVVVELPTERTPLQVAAGAGSRPIIASLYDEYGELSGAPKTELLSPCGSEECLLNPDLFRSQTESVV
ncbi:uncharacterized protein LOC143277514 [Babylonia areolata]|uniref:uncharacterized protein LOC143277514 n=1 Tax=Babylonia areolata TaxID=304850 RepID=UPI003FD30BE5